MASRPTAGCSPSPFGVVFALAAAWALAARADEVLPRRVASDADAVKRALVTLDVTFQDWAWDEPWRKRPPGTRSGSGLVLGDGRILTTASVVAGSTLLELHRGSEQTPWPARVVMVDHLANLALVAPDDPAFFAGLAPLAWADAPPPAADQGKVAFYRYRAARRLDAFGGTIVEVDGNDVGAGTAQLLTVAATAQMEGGGFGELVLQDAKFLGLAYAKWGDKVFFLPTPVLRTWLEDARQGDARKGFAAAGWRFQNLTNPELRAHLGVPRGREGILLSKVWPYATGAGVLEDGDVLLKLAGRELDARGNFEHPLYGPVRFGLLLTDGHVAGDTLDAEIVHAGVVKAVRLVLATDAPNRRAVPTVLAERQPRYLVHAGLVFQELSAPYLRAFGESAPLRLSILNELDGAAAPKDRARYVVLTQVLPDAATVGYENVRSRLVARVNGRAVQTLEEVAKALDKPVGGYQLLEFLENPDRVVLDAAKAEEAHARILKAYQIVPAQNLKTGW